MVVVDAKGSDDPKGAVAEVTSAVKGLKGVVTVTPATFNKALPKWLDRALPNVDVEGEGLRALDGSQDGPKDDDKELVRA